LLLACIALICLPSYTSYSHPKIRNSPLGILFKVSLHRVSSIAIVDVNTPLFRDNLHVHSFCLPNHLAQPDLGYQISILIYTRRARPSVHRSPACCIWCVHASPSWSPVFTEAVNVTAPFRLNPVNLYVLDDYARPLDFGRQPHVPRNRNRQYQPAMRPFWRGNPCTIRSLAASNATFTPLVQAYKLLPWYRAPSQQLDER